MSFFGDDPEAVRVLNDLIELGYDAAAAFQEASERVGDPAGARRLETFRDDHVHQIRDLAEVVRELGGHPTPLGRARNMLPQGRVVLASLLGELDILRAIQLNEDETDEAYERAVRSGHLPPDVTALIRRYRDHERVHRTWIARRLDELSRHTERELRP